MTTQVASQTLQECMAENLRLYKTTCRNYLFCVCRVTLWKDYRELSGDGAGVTWRDLFAYSVLCVVATFSSWTTAYNLH